MHKSARGKREWEHKAAAMRLQRNSMSDRVLFFGTKWLPDFTPENLPATIACPVSDYLDGAKELADTPPTDDH